MSLVIKVLPDWSTNQNCFSTHPERFLHELLSILDVLNNLACTDEVITYVAQQIIDGWTEQGSHGSAGSVQPEPHPGGLDWAIREVSMRSGFIAAKEILRLQEALKHEQEKNQKADEENAKLRRHLLTISTFE